MRARQGSLRFPQTLTIYRGPRHTAWAAGEKVAELIDQAAVPNQWDGARRMWSVPVQRVPDLQATAERAGTAVTVLAVSW